MIVLTYSKENKNIEIYFVSRFVYLMNWILDQESILTIDNALFDWLHLKNTLGMDKILEYFFAKSDYSYPSLIALINMASTLFW